MTTPPDLFFVGHSHVNCVLEAASARGLLLKALNLWAFGRPVAHGEGPPRLNPELEAMLEAVTVSTVGGSAHDMLGLAQHPRAFDFVLPGEEHLPLAREAELVGHAAVKAAVRALIDDEQLDLLRLLPGPGRRVLHLESPPPLEDNVRLGAEMGVLAFVPQPNLGPSPPWLRYKLWRVHSDIFRETCEASGGEFVPAPADALVEGAFLRPDLHAYPCHANPGYGALVLRQLGLAA